VHRGEFVIVSRDLADKNWLVGYYADNSPDYFYKYNRATRKSQFLFTNRPQLEDLQLAQMSPISYKSRDG
jgi:dipeptidyl aminopeptidase/acylaminoacyl peptidase